MFLEKRHLSIVTCNTHKTHELAYYILLLCSAIKGLWDEDKAILLN